MRIGLKVGSAVVTDGNGRIYHDIIESICNQIVFLKKQGHEVFLVSSGAIACDPNKTRKDGVRASVGQPRLMRIYEQYLKKWNIECSQLLYTDFDLSPPHEEHTKFVLEGILEESGLLPIINANDPVDETEYRKLKECTNNNNSVGGGEFRMLKECSDNDVLFKKVCLLVNADMAVIGFTENGLYDSEDNVIPVVNTDQADHQDLLACARGGGALGHGNKGMTTKTECLLEMATKGIYSVLVPAYSENFLLKAIEKDPEFGTVFIAPFEEHNS